MERYVNGTTIRKIAEGTYLLGPREYELLQSRCKEVKLRNRNYLVTLEATLGTTEIDEHDRKASDEELRRTMEGYVGPYRAFNPRKNGRIISQVRSFDLARELRDSAYREMKSLEIELLEQDEGFLYDHNEE